jgi:hypothetical protein
MHIRLLVWYCHSYINDSRSDIIKIQFSILLFWSVNWKHYDLFTH